MNKLNKIYEAMLKSFGCKFTEDYAVVLNMSGVDVPVKVDHKQMYLPTSENLNGVTIGKVFFHPACESIMSKETEVFKVIRKLTAAKIYSVFQPIFDVILNVAAKKSGKTLSGKMLEQMEPFKAVTKTVKQEVYDVIKTISIDIEDQGIDSRLINFSLIKGGKTDNDETAYYTATPSFPFYTELYRVVSQHDHLKPSERVTFNGQNVTMQALNVVIALFELALPSCVDPSRKKYSSTSPDAARLIAYLHSYALVASDLNALIGKFRKEFDAIGIYGIDLDWISDLDEIGELKSLIPAMDYNNYNLTSSPDTANSVNTNRISSFNPAAGLFSMGGGNNNHVTHQTNTPPAAPKAPDALPGEHYLGAEYSQNNGIYEYKYQQQNGMIRVKRLAEDGRFISEDFQYPQNNGNVGMPMNMNPMMMNPMMMNQMMMANANLVPLVGMNQGGNGSFVMDPYSRQPVMSNGLVTNNGLSQSAFPQDNGMYNGVNNGY
jgi:hypothetical protein